MRQQVNPKDFLAKNISRIISLRNSHNKFFTKRVNCIQMLILKFLLEFNSLCKKHLHARMEQSSQKVISIDFLA